MDEKLDLTALRRASAVRAAVCTALYALSLVPAAFSPAVFGLTVCPGALAGTAAAWYWLKALALCRGEKYLRKYFSRTLRAALVLPVFAVLSFAPLQIESLLASSEDLTGSLLWVLPFVLALPVLLCVFTAVALHASVLHMKESAESEGRMYRELPFAAMLIAAIGLALAAVWFIYMVLL